MGKNLKKVKRKQRDAKLIVRFDLEARKEYLTGFHKRKLERKQKAIDELKARAKEEQKQAKSEQRKAILQLEDPGSDEEGAADTIAEMTGVDKGKAQVTVETIEDNFSKTAFGGGSVKVRTSPIYGNLKS